MPQKVELIPFVDEVIESFINGNRNGNRTDAVQAISALPKKQAMVVAAYVIERMPGEPSRSNFLLALERHSGL